MDRAHLTAREVKKYQGSIEEAIRKNTALWDIHGWAFEGRSPRIRLVAKVIAKRAERHKDLFVPLPREIGGRLKVFVHATYARRPLRGPLPFSRDSLTGGVITPGAPIVVDTGSSKEWIGIAAVLRLACGPHILTCGHAFSASSDLVFADVGDDEPIASLTESYFEETPRLDAAICKLTDRGVELLEKESCRATTWFTKFRRPNASDNGKSAVFWATSPESTSSIEAPITSYRTSDAILFGDDDVHDGFIEMPFIASGGDSGSLLSVRNLYYGICAGHVGDVTLFTPFAFAIDRVRQTHPEAALWNPGTQRLV